MLSEWPCWSVSRSRRRDAPPGDYLDEYTAELAQCVIFKRAEKDAGYELGKEPGEIEASFRTSMLIDPRVDS